MFNIKTDDFEGLREALNDFVRFEGRHPSDEELRSVLWEAFDIATTYDDDLVDIWKAAGCPDLSILSGYTSIKDAIRGALVDVWVESLFSQAREYLEELV